MKPFGPPYRALLGFVAAAISVLVFHQGAWALFWLAGLMPPPYPMGIGTALGSAADRRLLLLGEASTASRTACWRPSRGCRTGCPACCSG